MDINKNDWLDWKNNPITLLLYKEMRQRISEAQEILGRTAGLEPLKDRFLVGMVQAFNETLEFEIEWEDADEESESDSGRMENFN